MPEAKATPIRFWSFVWLCIKEALRGTWQKADSIAVFVGLALGAVAYIIPSWEKTLTRLLLIVPLTILASVTVIRLLLSPFLVYRSRDTEASTAEEAFVKAIAARDETIKVLTTKPQRTPAEQHDYDTAKKALQVVGEKGLAAMRHIRRYRASTFAYGASSSPLPPGLNLNDTLWVYNHCASEGLLICNEKYGSGEKTFSVSPKMEKILDELLYDDSISAGR